MPLPFLLPQGLKPPPITSGPQPSACSRADSGRLQKEMRYRASLWAVPSGQGGLWPLAYTHSGKPWSVPLRKEAKGQS